MAGALAVMVRLLGKRREGGYPAVFAWAITSLCGLRLGLCLAVRSVAPLWVLRRLFFFQAEDGIRDLIVTGVQTCALPISWRSGGTTPARTRPRRRQPGSGWSWPWAGSYRLRRSSHQDGPAPRQQGPTVHVRPQLLIQRLAMCPHRPPCPPADRSDRDAAHTIAFHPEQGWSLLCNGVILFDDTGGLLPDH